MFTPLHSSMNQELFEKYVCIQSSHYTRKYNGTAHPSYRLKLKYPLLFFVSYFQLVSQQYESRTVWKVHKVATMKNMDDFHYAVEAIMCNHLINAFHCQQRWMEHKGQYW